MFCADAGIGARRIDEREQRQFEAVREGHQALRLTVPLWSRHAEIMMDAIVGIGAFLVADHDAAAPLKFREPTFDSFVVGKVTVACEWCVFLQQSVRIIPEVGRFGWRATSTFCHGVSD